RPITTHQVNLLRPVCFHLPDLDFTHLVYLFLLPGHRHHRVIHSFPTRRSSDLGVPLAEQRAVRVAVVGEPLLAERGADRVHVPGDRKSTRLNSSHVKTSYAVFCLKKKSSRSRSWFVWRWSCPDRPLSTVRFARS